MSAFLVGSGAAGLHRKRLSRAVSASGQPRTGTRRRALWAGLLLLGGSAAGTLAVVGSVGPALAAGGPTIKVCPTGCAYTLIQPAINAAPSGATITIAPGTYGGGLNTDNKNIKLLGAGAGQTTISGGYPNSSVEIDSGTVTISGVTMTGGHGAILNSGTVTLTNSTLSGNSAFSVGGIRNNGGTVTVNDSTVTGNADVAGGGISNDGGSVTLNDSTVTGNTALGADGGGEGGGIFNNGGTVTLNNSTISGNTATGDGGGIYNQAGTVTLKDSTVSGNNPDNCAPANSVPGCAG
jgi:hypothetical protein